MEIKKRTDKFLPVKKASANTKPKTTRSLAKKAGKKKETLAALDALVNIIIARTSKKGPGTFVLSGIANRIRLVS